MAIVMLGTRFDTMGGISSVVNAYRDAGLFERQRIRYVATHGDGPAARKLLLAAYAMVQVLGMLLAGKMDLAHVHISSRASFWRKLVITLPIILAGKPVVLHLHGSEFHIFHDEESSSRAKKLICWFFERAARVIVLSQTWHDWVASRFPKARAVLVHNPVRMPEPTVFELREPTTVLFLGRIGKRKGAYDLLPAIAKLSVEFPDMRLIMGGDGELDEARRMAESLGLASHLELPGWVTGAEKQALLSKASIYVLPSYHEGLPMSVLEAMAAGLPVISTRVGGIPEAVRDGVDGFLVDAGDVTALTDRLRALLSDADLRRRMGDAARERVRMHFSTEVIVPRIETIYAELLGIQVPSSVSQGG